MIYAITETNLVCRLPISLPGYSGAAGNYAEDEPYAEGLMGADQFVLVLVAPWPLPLAKTKTIQ